MKFVRNRLLVLATVALTLTACADNGTSPALPGAADTSGYDAVTAGSPVVDASAIAPGSWADEVKQSGTPNVGGTDAGPLFSIKDPATGKVTGFDAGLSQMLAATSSGSRRRS